MDASQESPPRGPRPRDPLLKPPGLSADRRLQLSGAFEELAARCAENLRDLAASPIEIAFADFTLVDAGEFADGLAGGRTIALIRSADGGQPWLIGADRGCLDTAFEAIMGADGSEPPPEQERPLSALEMRVAGTVLERLAISVWASLFEGGAPSMQLRCLHAAEGLPAAERPAGPAVTGSFRLSALDRGGAFTLLVPQSVLQETAKLAATPARTSAKRQDPHWGRRIEQELQRTQVRLHAVLDECELTLGDLADLRVGQFIPLRATPRSQVRVVSNDQTVFWCELGQADGAYTVRVKEFADEEQELADAILSK